MIPTILVTYQHDLILRVRPNRRYVNLVRESVSILLTLATDYYHVAWYGYPRRQGHGYEHVPFIWLIQ